jgi:signal transduction histidine kinase
MRQEFISNVSHEIQSPLTSIRGFARALQNEQLSPADRAHYLNIIEIESMRLSKLSDNLLALASLDAEQMKFEPKAYRLDRQIRNLILACEPQWTDKSLDMDVALEEVVITADEDMLSQVWINLIHNSIKFTPCGGSVRILLQYQADRVVFRITDSGIGISADDQAHVFERFFKAEKARDRAKGGSGLGLAIAKKIVEMHKGTIGVESELGAGACFTVCLPANSRESIVSSPLSVVTDH